MTGPFGILRPETVAATTQTLMSGPSIRGFMPGMGLNDLTGRITTNARARIDSVTKSAVDEFRNEGAWAAVSGLLTRFGRNNRQLVPILTK